MKFILINYHYIREKSNGRGIFPVSAEFLLKQVAAIRELGFKPGRLCDLEDPEEFVNEKLFHITFDDGLTEQLPVIERLLDIGCYPTVSVSTSKYQTSLPDLVHVIHFLRQKLDTDVFLSLFTPYSTEIAKFSKRANLQYRYDDPGLAKIKYFTNLRSIK